MSALSAIKAVLEADATLLALATGGIYDFNEAGREGINRTTTPAAFDSDLILKPSILIRQRSIVPDYVLQDDSSQYQSLNEMIEVWVFADSSYSTIDSIHDRVYLLLHATQPNNSNAFACRWAGTFRGSRDEAIDGFADRIDFQITSYRSV